MTVYNTPLRYEEKLNADIGLFVQDSWALNRLTINTGLRWEYLAHEVAEQQSGSGRFVAERNFDAIPMPTWKDFAPRIGVVYDLFGNSKTAVKASFNRYNESRTTQFATKYNPLALDQRYAELDRRQRRRHRRRACVGCTYLTAGCEINFAQLPANFGVRSLATVDPDFQRTYNLEYTAGIQHELFPRVSVAATYYRRKFYDLPVTDNLLRTPADYRAVDVVSPLDGEVFQAYTVQPRPQLARVHDFDTNAGSDRKQTYNGGDITFNARLPRGGTLFGGFTMERTLRVTCDEPDDPNFLRFCDDGENDIPCLKQFKFAGTYPLGWGIQASVSFQSIAGRALGGYIGHGRPPGSQQDQRPRLRRRRQPDRHPLAHHADHALCGQLHRPVHAGRAGHPGHDRGPDARCRSRRRHRNSSTASTSSTCRWPSGSSSAAAAACSCSSTSST